MCHHAAIVVQILFATRTLGLSEQAVGLSYVGMGVGTMIGERVRQSHQPPHRPRALPGARLRDLRRRLAAAGARAGQCAGAWPRSPLMLMLFGVGAVLIFINFLALRQAVTPEPLLGRMTSTMRWLILMPAGPGALLGGWLGEHVGLRAALAFAGGVRCCWRSVAWRPRLIRGVRELPKPERADDWVGARPACAPAAWPTPPEA